MESEIWQYYRTQWPGQVQVLGPDVMDGSAAQLGQFRASAGNLTFPLLLCCDGLCGGSENLLVQYGQRDNYVVINKQGIIRYHAYDHWPYGNRYHLNELRGTIDSLVSSPVGVDEGLGSRTYRLNAVPNPFRDAITLEFAHPSEKPLDALVTVHDLAGRRIATLWNGPAARGWTRVTWEGGAEDGARVAPGVYVVLARLGGVELRRRLVYLK